MCNTDCHQFTNFVAFIPAAASGASLGFVVCNQVELAVTLLSLWIGVTAFASSGAYMTLMEHAPRFIFDRAFSYSKILG